MLEIRKLGDPVLREQCAPVEAVDPQIEGLVEQMQSTLEEAPGRVGLAAPQVGVSKRLFVYDVGHGTRCLINPEIIESEGLTPFEEGCLSVPGVYVSLERYEKVKVRCSTPSGHNIVIEVEGFPAQVFQHECDHLDGILILDRCDEEERCRAMEEYQQLELERDQTGG